MSIYEIYLPVAEEAGIPFSVNLFRTAFDEMAEHFGVVETWPIYRPRQAQAEAVKEDEYYRYRLDVPDNDENRLWLLHWHAAQQEAFGIVLWMIRYRVQSDV